MIPITRPSLGEAEVTAARDVILSGWVTQGPRVKEFEDDFASFVGSKHACAVSSCTAALHVALLTLGVGPGDVVIAPSHSFIATANSVRQCGAEPVFVDIDPHNLNMSPESLERFLYEDCENRDGQIFYRSISKFTSGESPLGGFIKARDKRTKSYGSTLGRVAAVMPVHQVGMPCDLNAILSIARKFELPVIEDAACAIGSEILINERNRWEGIGKPHGDIACFSFHPRKVITTGDGGMLTTKNPEYDRTFRMLRQHGMNITDLMRHQSEKVVFENYLMTGYNYRMTDIQAAIGIEQVKRLPEILRKRRALSEFYSEVLSTIPGLKIFPESANVRTNRQSYVVRLSDSSMQKDVMENLQKRGIQTRRGIMCAHLEPPYSAFWPVGSLPHSEAARDTCIILPLFPEMEQKKVETVCAAIRDIMTCVS